MRTNAHETNHDRISDTARFGFCSILGIVADRPLTTNEKSNPSTIFCPGAPGEDAGSGAPRPSALTFAARLAYIAAPPAAARFPGLFLSG